jgi:hypothetical protein
MCIKLGMLAVLTCFCTGHKSLQLPYKTYGKHHHTKHMGLGYFFMPWALLWLGRSLALSMERIPYSSDIKKRQDRS